MNILDMELPDLSGHPPPPQLTLGQYEHWVLEMSRCGMRKPMTDEEMKADFLRNEGSQTEEWPDFGDV